MPDEYDYGAVRSSLKLKKPSELFKKSKKKKSKKSKKHTDASSNADGGRAKTEAEQRFDDMQMKRKLERIDQLAEKSFGDRVKEFNEKMERTPEHNDMPKVGPG
ncbi:hypothetical protein GGI11_006997 [Coemansia sp. RSA 2049]|nr:hypothetical protein GGI11_006997 [Coemansia sp. RSA 2049]KAJ2514747.1 hypothetical protein H4217_005580 [Coemansia sp. RSA 1939]KAJ2589170.1 hypothetical protein EV177_009288 [Coemansia sp. RSA 1804]